MFSVPKLLAALDLSERLYLIMHLFGPNGDQAGFLFNLQFFFSYEGHLTTKSDVYSFGVVLLEMLTGRQAIDKNRPSGEQNLVEWAKPYLQSKRRIFQVMDPRIEGQYSRSAALKAAALTFVCLSSEAKYRPTMDEVVKALEQLQDSNDTGSSGNEPPK